MYHTLVLSGGATDTAAFFGSLRYLNEHMKLKSVKRFVGSSAGCLVALVLALGVQDTEEIHNWTNHLMFEHEMNMLQVDGVLDIIDTCGIDPGDTLMRCMELTLEHWGYDKNLTFRQLSNLASHELIVCGFNLHKRQHEYFSSVTSPDMPVALAVRLSMSIPLIFQPVWYEGYAYMDPLVGRNFPYDFPGCQLHDTSVLGLITRRLHHPLPRGTPLDLGGLMRTMTDVILKYSNEHSGRHQYTMVPIIIDSSEIDDVFVSSEMKFQWSLDTSMKLEQIGYLATKQALENDLPEYLGQ